ncbi:MarR family winged helix-turn-helix transcriptional regulator [Chloroflexota bacterium]
MVKINTKLVDFKVDEPYLRLFIYYLQTADAINRYANILFYKEGLSFIKFIVLIVLKLNGGTMRPTDIARWTFRERHDITTLIRRLEKAELVRIERNIMDRRAIDVILTEKEGRRWNE